MLIGLRAVLAVRVDGVSWEADDRRDGSREEYRPPESADESGYDNHSAGAVDLGLCDDAVKQRHGRKEVAEDQVSGTAVMAQ